MSVWDNFGKLNKLNIEFKEKASAKSARIYANGNNQVAISIKVDISAKDGKPLILPDEELLNAAYIVNYENGKKLNKKGGNDNDWYYTDENFGYDKVIGYSGNGGVRGFVSSGYEQEVVFYLSTTVVGNGRFSVGIDIPGVGEFNTSTEGTETKNGPKGEAGDVFKCPQYISVEGVYAYSWSRVRPDTGREGCSRMVRKLCELDDIIYSGVTRHLRYRVAPSGTDSKFVSINFPVNEVNVDTIKFRNNILPNMIIGRGGDKFSAYFVFFNDVDTGIEEDSYFLVKQDSTGYKYKYELPEIHSDISNEKEIYINILEVEMDFPDVGKYGWKDAYKSTSINAIDNYGNFYKIDIGVNYSSEDLFSVELKMN